MNMSQIPTFCIPSIIRWQAQCPHLNSIFSGGWYFDNEFSIDLANDHIFCGRA